MPSRSEALRRAPAEPGVEKTIAQQIAAIEVPNAMGERPRGRAPSAKTSDGSA
jgi:hypothetical protein